MNIFGVGVSNLQEAFKDLNRCVNTLVLDVEQYLHREGWQDYSMEEQRLQVLKRFESQVCDILQEEEEQEEQATNNSYQSIKRALDEMKRHSFLRAHMDLLMDHMMYKDVKEYIRYVSLLLLFTKHYNYLFSLSTGT